MRSEIKLIERIRSLAACQEPASESASAGAKATNARLVSGIGDDCAVYQSAPGLLSIVSSDALVEGVHFALSWHPPRLLGRKSVAVNISDIAAMGGTPRFLLLNLGLSGKENDDWVDQLLAGVFEAAGEYQCLLIGGDTVKSPNGVFLSLTVLGEVEEDCLRLRSTAKAGDDIWVSGRLGLAAAGLELCRKGAEGITGIKEKRFTPLVAAHLDPKAQVRLARALVKAGLAGAMMDISDGIASDLARICQESGCGATIEEKLVELDPLLCEAARLCQAKPLSWALSGGEDYQLLFTASPENREKISSLATEFPLAHLHRIGKIKQEAGVFLLGKNKEKLDFGGYDHFCDNAS